MIFLIVGIIGLLFFILSLMFDGLLEALHIDFLDNDFFSITTIMAFITIFGLTGYLTELFKLSLPIILTTSIVSGLLIALLTGYLVRVLKKSSQQDGTYSTDSLIDQKAKVLSPASTEGSYSTILVNFNGSEEHLNAICESSLNKNEIVKITKVISPTLVEIEPTDVIPELEKPVWEQPKN